ncbi:hypothetical protein WJ32_10230 [Burkholderia ubonensis]|uniref:Uncharacterized protein n=2 Tax=Burkholderia ubonensis TaxID=101571 RepID=A0A103RHJ8_9BURK|nr:hypothetical protein WJ32_10230 [Burkholderia ubonensis]KVG67943.1 hypothetical protein WJ33_24105 [Burkholderia ubonensis]
MKKLHETAERLYHAAKKLRGVEGPANVARLLNESPQLVNNWERRGMSAAGMIRAASIIGCRVDWLKTGEGKMADEGSAKETLHSSNIPIGQDNERHTEAPAVVQTDIETRARRLASALAEAASNGLISERLISALEGMLEAGISQTSAVSFAKHSRAAVRASVGSGETSTNDTPKRRSTK